MLQTLALVCTSNGYIHLSDIQCPNLRTLFLSHVDDVIKPLTVAPLNNVHHLSIHQHHDNEADDWNLRYLRLLEALPNLVSLSWTCSSPNELTVR